MAGKDGRVGLRVRMLGPFEAELDGRPLVYERKHAEARLLALLVLADGQPQQRDVLAETLWPESLHHDALRSLTRALCCLRKTLGTEGRRLVATGHDFLKFEAAGVDVDLWSFERAARRNDPNRLGEALKLCRGPLLAAWDDNWAASKRADSEKELRKVVERLAVLERGLGRHDVVIGRLRWALSRWTDWPDGTEQLMLALRDGGDLDGAIAEYDKLRRRLAPKKPTAELQQLAHEIEARIERADPTRARGARSLNLGPSARSLPSFLTDLIGRTADFTAVSELMGSSRLVTLTGIGGIGKTRLAVRIADARADAYVDGAQFVDLGADIDPIFIDQVLIEALGVGDLPGSLPRERLARHIGDRSRLLVLDGCERHRDACASLVSDLLRACPLLDVLATSQHALGLRSGEHRCPVGPLGVPKDGSGPEQIEASDAVRLFRARAEAASSRQLSASDLKAVADICRLLDGIPLAIELAAPWMRVLSLEQIRGQLSDRFRLLRGGGPELPARHRTMMAAMEWSYGLLSNQQRALFRRLSVFAGGWTYEDARGICSGGVVPDTDLLDVLTALVDTSLVTYGGRGAGERYTMLQTVQEFAATKLRKSREHRAVKDRHLEAFSRLADDAGPELDGPEAPRWLRELDVQRENLRAALRHAVTIPSDPRGLGLAGSLRAYWEMRGLAVEGHQWLRSLLEAGDEVPVEVRRRALNACGHMAARLGDLDGAHRWIAESVALCRESGDLDLDGLVHALHNQGNVSRQRGELDSARACFEEALEVCEARADEQNMASSLNGLGIVLKDLKDVVAARHVLERALGLATKLGLTSIGASASTNLGILAANDGDLQEASRCMRLTLGAHEKLGHRWGRANALRNLAIVDQLMGDLSAARVRQAEALVISRDSGDRDSVAWSLSAIAMLEGRENRLDRAVALSEAASAVRTGMGFHLPPAEQKKLDDELAEWRTHLGDREFERCRQMGGALTWEKACEFALSSEGVPG